MPDGFDETNIWLNVDQIDDGPGSPHPNLANQVAHTW